MSVILKATVVPARFDEEGGPDLRAHEKVTRGRRNVPVLTADGSKQAVDEHGVPKVEVVEFVHFYLKPENLQPFHIEVTAEQAAEFEIGKEVTLTIG